MTDFPSFFTNVDRIDGRPDKDPASPFPAWYFTNQIDELENNISSLESQIKMGMAPVESIMGMKMEISKMRDRLTQIKASKIKLTNKQKDHLAEFYGKAGRLIADSMPTETKMKKGLASAHEEVKLNTQYKFGVHGYEDLLKALGIKTKSGKVTRNQLCVAWKIAGKYLGEVSNTEFLRTDANYGTYQIEKTLAETEAS